MKLFLLILVILNFDQAFSLTKDNKVETNQVAMTTIWASKWFAKHKNYLVTLSDKELKTKLKQELISKMSMSNNTKIDPRAFNNVFTIILNEKNNLILKSAKIWLEKHKHKLFSISSQELKSKLNQELITKNFKIDRTFFNNMIEKMNSNLIASKWLQKNKNHFYTMSDKQLHIRLANDLMSSKNSVKIDEKTFLQVIKLILKEKRSIISKLPKYYKSRF